MLITDVLDVTRDCIVIPRACIPFVGGLEEAMFLQNLLRWTGYQSDPCGWIYKTQEELQEETYLSPYRQRCIRKLFVERGWLEERSEPLRHRFYYRVVCEKIEADWQEWIETHRRKPEPVPAERRRENERPAECQTESLPEVHVFESDIDQAGTLKQGRTSRDSQTPPASHECDAAPQGAFHEPVPKSLDDVIAYGCTIGATRTQCEEFFDHFEANGWRVGGRAPMRDWRAALRNWKRRAALYTRGMSSAYATFNERADELGRAVESVIHGEQ
jgi:hypothetical protein